MNWRSCSTLSIFNGVETTLLRTTASIACFLNQGGFRADISSSALRSDSELAETSLDILAQKVLRLCNTCTGKLLSPQVGQMLHCGLGQHSVAAQHAQAERIHHRMLPLKAAATPLLWLPTCSLLMASVLP